MKHLSTALFLIALPGLAMAQTASGDSLSISDIQLNEIVVSAPKVVHKADMDVLYPSASAVKASQNSLELLRHLMIPTLTINEFTGAVRTSGQEVQVRINGRKASSDQLKTIDPATVKRVEWIDDPGVRYGDAPGVINIIVANPTVGGSLMTQGMASFTQVWGNGYADLKFNNGRSQWSVGALGRYTNKIDAYREYSETFTRPDGVSVTRTESPLKGYVSNTDLNPSLSYNYINPSRTVVWVGLRMSKQWPTVRSNTGLMSLSGSDEQIRLYERESTSGLRPKFNAYVEQKLPHSQTIAFDFDASLFHGRSSHVYRETLLDGRDDLLTDVATSIKDRQNTFNIEGTYIKQFSGKRVTAGAQYSSTNARTTRESGAVSRQRQDRAYFYAEYFQRVGRVSLTGGLGTQYSGLHPSGFESSTTWSLRPRVSVSWRAHETSQFRFSFTTGTSTPSSSQTDPNPQQIDGFQYQVGNPSLHTYNNYKAKLQYNFTFPRVSGRLEGVWTRAPHAIAPSLSWVDDKLVTTFENSRGHTSWQVSLSPQVEILHDILVLKGTLRFYRATSEGTGYRHTYTCWSGDIGLSAFYRGLLFDVSYEANPSTLWGETLSHAEKVSTIMVGYRWRGFTFSAGMFMPFTRYSMGSESLNRYNSNSNTLRSRGFDRMPVVRIAYNVNWGRQKKAAQKLINASDDLRQSKAAGR